MTETIKVSILDLTNAAQELSWLGEQKLPGDRVLPLIRTRRVAQEHLTDFSEARDAIVKRYAGGEKQIAQGLVTQANEEITALTKEVVEIPDPELTWKITQTLFEGDGRANRLQPLLFLIKGVPLDE